MDWRSHLAIGIVLSFIAFAFIFGVRDVFVLIPLLLFSGVSALIPDIDHELSVGKRLLDAFAIGIAILVALAARSLLSFFAMLGAYFVIFKLLKPKHRGITHTPVFCFGFSVLIYLVAGMDFAIAAFIGYGSHLLADRK